MQQKKFLELIFLALQKSKLKDFPNFTLIVGLIY